MDFIRGLSGQGSPAGNVCGSEHIGRREWESSDDDLAGTLRELARLFASGQVPDYGDDHHDQTYYRTARDESERKVR